MEILADILIFALCAGTLVGFHELDKKIKGLKKSTSEISPDLVEIKMELESIFAEISNLQTEISLLSDKFGPSKS